MDFTSNEKSNSSDGSDTSDRDDLAIDSNDYTDAKAEVHDATKGDNRDVWLWRLVVKFIMIALAITLTAVTYVHLKQTETIEFLIAFEIYSEFVLSYAAKELASQSEALEAMSDLFATYTLATTTNNEDAWPYVTLPYDQFEEHALHVISSSNDGVVLITPIVDDVTTWNKYNSDAMAGSNTTISHNMFAYDDGGIQLLSGKGPFTPLHQVYPSPSIIPSINGSIINYDSSSDPFVNSSLALAYNLDLLILSGLLPLPLIRETYPDIFNGTEPISTLIEPIHSSFDEISYIVGYVQCIFQWTTLFSKFIGQRGHPVVCTIENSCGDAFSVKIDDHKATLLDFEDSKKMRMNDVNMSSIIGIDVDVISLNEASKAGVCVYTLTVFPAIEFRQAYNLSAALYAAVIGFAMMAMVVSFFAYDYFVKRRNERVIQKTVQSTAIVTSLFPSNVRDRLYREQEDIENNRKQARRLAFDLHGGDIGFSRANESASLSKPLADLYTESTVMFADIAGFTAWSSVREPCQVFVLLETLYGAFDAIAKRRRIFKIETIGDCYVAVAGVPNPMIDHAIAMCKFARDILTKMRILTKQMEASLGPDTGDLSLRIGLHSGPVTAGVLRGERARFQLFGDTMNTAARMEQTGLKNRIQVSQSTADCLHAGGKSHWLIMRDEKVIAKGKGELVTYWLEVKSDSSGEQSSRHSETGSERFCGNNDMDLIDKNKTAAVLQSEKTNRLIDWNTDVLYRLMQQIIASRGGASSQSEQMSDENCDELQASFTSTSPLEEVKEIIPLPQMKKSNCQYDKSTVKVSGEVFDQLRKYVSCIANMYNKNEFHNFEHASHVTMSVTKLLSRIVAPSDALNDYRDHVNKDLMSSLHDHTYGIASDPLTQFACVFSALIHDVDHAGVPNTQLVNENSELALRFNGKSVAEQNSIVLAWGLFIKKEFNDLRNAICATKSELVRFRQIVVNAVMATDIMDKDLKNIRNLRWTKAFADESVVSVETNASPQEMLDQVNRKATVVIEHIIQASDVSHTMQHWHIYRKWNESFYFECYSAYANGRSIVDPTDMWYQGELDFFDYYVIPLAKILQKCGAFGVSGSEYLQYAMSNRLEWQTQGNEIVVEMKKRVLEKRLTNDLQVRDF